MKLDSITVLVFIMCSLFLSANVSAADISFKVPLQYSNLHPDVEKIKVSCEVEGLRPKNGGDSSGRITKILTPSKMAHNKVIVLKFPIAKGQLKSQMQRAASCSLSLKKKGSSNYETPRQGNTPFCTSQNTWICANKPNTPFNVHSVVHELHTL